MASYQVEKEEAEKELSLRRGLFVASFLVRSSITIPNILVITLA